ncbi:cation transporting ATPase C-terminal domain-containing protein [Acetanaerobacterium elongatum]|uniref:Ca2+-transporting ATPase n=1 Tax=Acetanaerobacterium elongatum TaxID=258515 RepID=A0A1G9WN21_9FIRM|nr:cation transporting ATPase C-terminal domain-containing protein [Acetanaerobacterium elongatum]SDM85591.1 Ca2+-transporting ATPase [Acetanaerobacterium elongatum]
MKWHSAAAAQLCTIYGTDEEKGLTQARYTTILQKYGKNEIRRPWKKGFLCCLCLQLKSVLNLFMAVVFVLALLLFCLGIGTAGAVWVTGLAATINILLGATMEYRSRVPLKGFSRITAATVRAVREGQTVNVPAEDLVPGDIILLSAGERIPADARLLECCRLTCDEYALTYSHSAVVKNAGVVLEEDTPLAERVNMVYCNTMVQAGTARAMVTATGADTEFAIQAEESAWGEPSAATKRLSQAGLIAIAILVIATAGAVIGALFMHTSPSQLFLTLFTAAAAAIPFTLTAAAAISAKTGVKHLAENGAAFKDIKAIETLAQATVLCTGKTGILTQGEMVVKQLWAGDRPFSLSAKLPENVLALLKLAVLCCNDEQDYQSSLSPADTALMNAAMRNGLKKQRLDEAYPLAEENAVICEAQRTIAVRHVNGVPLPIIKGAFEAVAPLCAGGLAEDAAKAYRNMCDLNLTVVAVAYQPSGVLTASLKGLTLAGLIGLYDPLRADAQAAIEDFISMGVTPILLTGEDTESACYAAEALGILKNERQAISGADIAAFTDEELSAVVGTLTVYSGISAFDRARVVRAWQKKGHTVLAVGSDTGSLPAFETADSACCAQDSSDQALQALADVITAKGGLLPVAEALRGARSMIISLKRPAGYLCVCACALAFTAAALIWLGAGGLPLLAQTLFIGAFISLPFALALSIQAPKKAERTELVPLPSQSLLSMGAVLSCGLKGLITALAAVGAYLIGSRLFITDLQEPSAATGSTMLFLVLLLAQPLLASVFKTNSVSGTGSSGASYGLAVFITLLSAVGIAFWRSLAALLGVTPLSFVHWGAAVMVTAVLGAVLWAIQVIEVLYRAVTRKER